MVKSKSNALRHFKVDPVLKIDETVYRQAESMGPHSKSCIIRAGTTCTVYEFRCTVQSRLPSVEPVQHVLYINSGVLYSLDYPV